MMSRINGKLLIILILVLATMSNQATEQTKTDQYNDYEILNQFGYESLLRGVVPDPSLIALLAQVIRWYQSNIKIIKSQILVNSTKAKSKISSLKKVTTSLSFITKEIHKKHEKDIDLNTNRTINFSGYMFQVGNISPTACMRRSHEWAKQNISNNLESKINVLKHKLANTIAYPDDITPEVLEDLDVGLNGNESLLFIGDTKNVNDIKRLEVSIKSFVNPRNIKQNEYGTITIHNLDRTSKLIKYKQMVLAIQNVLIELHSENIFTENNVSPKAIEDRLYATAISNIKPLALQAKNSNGNYKEINESLSTWVMFLTDSSEILKKKKSMYAVIATGVSDGLD